MIVVSPKNIVLNFEVTNIGVLNLKDMVGA